RRITFAGLAVIVAIWTVDALVQVVSGTSPLFWGIDAIKQATSGRPMCSAEQHAMADRLGGVLGPCNLKLGVVLAGLSPFLLFLAACRLGAGASIGAAPPIGLVVLSAGSGASWLTVALVLRFSG